MTKRKSLAVVATLLLMLVGPVGEAVLGAAAEPDWPSLEQQAISLLRRYVQINTTNPPGNEIRAARFLKSVLDQEGIESRVIESAPGRGNLYARLKGDGSKKALILLNHMDVVPAEERFWRERPFSGLLKGGYIWGRGALDMKAGAILELMTVLALKRQKIALKRDLVFLGTADEEAGGAMGAGYLLKRHFELFRGAEFVLNEGGRIHVRDDGTTRYYSVGLAEKSPLWVTVTAGGGSGHGSRPGADSAVNRLIRALQRIAQYEAPIRVVPEVQRFYADLALLEPSAHSERFKDLTASLRDPGFAAEFTRDPGNNARVRSTIAITMLQGSKKVNVVPSEASAQLDIRLLPGEDAERFLSELRQVVDDESIKLEPTLSFSAPASPMDTEVFGAISEVAKRYDPGVVVTTPLLAGFTDCHYFRQKAIHCYGFMPIRVAERDRGLAHGNDERISVESVKSGVRMLYEIVRKLVAA